MCPNGNISPNDAKTATLLSWYYACHLLNHPPHSWSRLFWAPPMQALTRHKPAWGVTAASVA